MSEYPYWKAVRDKLKAAAERVAENCVLSGAEERSTHPEGKRFTGYFEALLHLPGRACWERDVLRASKETLWANWKLHAEGKLDV